MMVEIKKHGSESFGKGDNYDALWKYENALLLCRGYPSLKADVAAIHSDIAAVCIKLGDSENEELLDPKLFSQSVNSHSICSQVCWYAFTQQHASKALAGLDPESGIQRQV